LKGVHHTINRRVIAGQAKAAKEPDLKGFNEFSSEKIIIISDYIPK